MLLWKDFIASEMRKEYFIKLNKTLAEEAKKYTIFPPKEDIFNAFKYCEIDQIKVVILGQDCYFNPGQAHGLCFSVPKGVKPPPSLHNIFKELKSDLNIGAPAHGCLEGWAKQGVLLLNSALTVRAGQPASHSKIGWEVFTDTVISLLNNQQQPIVFILWGGFARSKKPLITNNKHLILESAHPSPLSAYNGFFGSKPFSKTNNFLIKNNINPIDWEIK